ncbi:MAG TPA: hypothetical protein ENI85_05610 [Deltaproteobacteria bacterium]|nr:hypothetical protein [Deltaproteobacteria bacterium]
MRITGRRPRPGPLREPGHDGGRPMTITSSAGQRVVRLLVAFLLVFPSLASAGDDDRSGPAVPTPELRDGPNLVMGTGTPREPRPFTREQRLLDAVRRGDRAVVERALELGVPVETADDMARSALLLAVRDAGDRDLVRFLHERGAAIDRADADGRTPLSFAASAGRLDLARYLVAQGASVDRADRRGRTPLFHAVLANQIRLVSYLIDQGADVDVRDRYGDTPLMLACAKGFDAMARLLLAHGADPLVRDQEGRTARDRAAPGHEACRRLGPG